MAFKRKRSSSFRGSTKRLRRFTRRPLRTYRRRFTRRRRSMFRRSYRNFAGFPRNKRIKFKFVDTHVFTPLEDGITASSRSYVWNDLLYPVKNNSVVGAGGSLTSNQVQYFQRWADIYNYLVCYSSYVKVTFTNPSENNGTFRVGVWKKAGPWTMVNPIGAYDIDQVTTSPDTLGTAILRPGETRTIKGRISWKKEKGVGWDKMMGLTPYTSGKYNSPTQQGWIYPFVSTVASGAPAPVEIRVQIYFNTYCSDLKPSMAPTDPPV